MHKQLKTVANMAKRREQRKEIDGSSAMDFYREFRSVLRTLSNSIKEQGCCQVGRSIRILLSSDSFVALAS